MNHPRFAGALAGALLLAACTDRVPLNPSTLDSRTEDNDFEVWVVDQSNTTGLAYGGRILIYDGTDLMGESAPSAVPTATLDLAAEADALCTASTGTHPVRPHMLLFNGTDSHAVLSFVASGHVVIFDAAARRPVSCIRASAGAGGARQAHAALPSPDDSYILVANQNGKLLERIDTDFAAGRFELNPAAALDLAGCTTPNGLPCQAPELRPDNAPICPIVDASSQLGFVTLRGGGMLVVDPRQTPMRIVAEYDRGTVAGNGCGGLEAGGAMYINSGGGTTSNLHGFDIYRFPLAGYDARNAPNLPAPLSVFTREGHDRDSHGMTATRDGRYVWALDRAANVAEVFEAASGEYLRTVELAGAVSSDPTPDLVDIAPSGNRIFVTLRGPNPLSGDPHVATGSTPGIGIIQVTQGGRGGVLTAVVPIRNPDATGTERADPHGIRVRRR